jgi:hypothetical protein
MPDPHDLNIPPEITHNLALIADNLAAIALEIAEMRAISGEIRTLAGQAVASLTEVGDNVGVVGPTDRPYLNP